LAGEQGLRVRLGLFRTGESARKGLAFASTDSSVAASAGRAAAGVLRLEEHNALTTHQERRRLEAEGTITNEEEEPTARARKIRDKAQLLAGMALDTAPDTLTWKNGAWVSGDGSDPTQIKTIEDTALYAHGTGALPPGVEGRLDGQTVYND
jgi:hypothetical protein